MPESGNEAAGPLGGVGEDSEAPSGASVPTTQLELDDENLVDWAGAVRTLRELQQAATVVKLDIPPYAKAMKLLDSVYGRPLTDDQAVTLASQYAVLAGVDAALAAAGVPDGVISRITGRNMEEYL